MLLRFPSMNIGYFEGYQTYKAFSSGRQDSSLTFQEAHRVSHGSPIWASYSFPLGLSTHEHNFNTAVAYKLIGQPLTVCNSQGYNP